MSSIRLFILSSFAELGPMHGHRLRLVAERNHVTLWTDITVGAVYGAIFISLLPVLIRYAADAWGGAVPVLSAQLPAVQNAVFGLVIIAFLILEPRGLARLWQRAKDYVRYWPFRY